MGALDFATELFSNKYMIYCITIPNHGWSAPTSKSIISSMSGPLQGADGCRRAEEGRLPEAGWIHGRYFTSTKKSFLLQCAGMFQIE